MISQFSRFNKLFLVLLAGIFLLTAQPVLAAEQYISDNSVRQDPLQSIKERGQMAVSEFSGAATYSYPIDLPAGRNGMTPNVAITHNSQDGSLSNIVGYRWSLSHYSISRLNTRGVDQLYSRRDFMANLPFESGELKEISLSDEMHGEYGQRFENSFAVYQFRDDNSWLVTDRRGNRYIFGSSNESRQFDPGDPSRTAEWMLEEIRDPNDNFIRYTYQKIGNQIYPNRIFYTGHGSEDGIFEVRFLLNMSQVRPDRQYSYATGFLVDTNYLVSGIEVYAEGKLRRKYELAYTQVAPLVRQTLGGITETGYSEAGSPTSLPPTTFDYTPSVISWQKTDLYQPPIFFVHYNKTYNQLTSAYPIFTDATGDGLVDFPNISQEPDAKVYINDGKGGWKVESKAGKNFPYVREPNLTTKFLDFNGDTVPDRFGSYVDYYVYPPKNKSYLQIFGQGSATDTIDIPLANGTGNSNYDNGASVADLNGDGLPDIIQSRSRYDSNEYPFIEKSTCLNHGGDSCLLTNLWQSPTPIIYDDNLGIQRERITYIEDCNRDGLADIQGYGGVWLNDGKGGWVKPQGQKCEFTPPDGMFYRSVDLNGDGLLDRVHALIEVGYSTETPVNKLILNTGQEYLDDVGDFPLLFGRGNGTGQTNSDMSGIRILDLNGDQLPDVVQSYHETQQIGSNWVDTIIKNVWLHTGSRPYFLKAIRTSAGAEINLEYKTSAQYMKPDGTQANPKLPIIVDTVSRMTVNDGMGNVSLTDYFYEDGHYYFENSYDKSFAGFRVVTKTDGLGYRTKSYYHQNQYSVNDSGNGEYADHISKKGRPYRTESYDENGQIVALIINRFEHKTLGENRYFPFLSQTLSRTFDGGAVKATAKAFSYDDIGNVVQVVDYGEVTATDNSGAFSDTGNDLLKTIIRYISESAFSYENKLEDQNGTQLSHSKTYYDGLSLGQVQKGNVTAMEQWLDSPAGWLRSETHYNNYGLPFVSVNPRGFGSTIEYDSAHLYPATICNAKNQCYKSVTNLTIGKNTYTRDLNGSVTETVHDGLGRPLRVEKDGQLISTADYNDTASPRFVHSIAYNDDDTEVDSFTYLDALGRAIQTKQEAPGGKWVATQTIYDERGNVEKQIQPYFSPSSNFESLNAGKLGTAFAYDARGRLLTSSNSLGVTVSSYSGWQVTTTDPNGHSKTHSSDARGNLVRVEEKNGGETYITRYAHDPLGRLLEVRDAEGNQRAFAYDSLGRRTFQSKLGSSAGWSYRYDENGNLLQKSDPKGQTLTYHYDELDRVLSENELSFTYDQGQNAVGRLSEVEKPGYGRRFTHDLWGRVVGDQKLIDGQSFDFSYAYDRMGAITSLTYPDGTLAEYEYDTAHRLARVRAASKTFAEGFIYTPLGQVAEMTLGSGTVIKNTHDENQLYRLTKKSATGSLQDYRYTYDPVGNLLKLDDANTGLTAKTIDYAYDGLDRLTRADYTSTANEEDLSQTFAYDPLGNILFKSDVGHYVYDGQHPHAVTQAGTHAYDYDANGNMVVRDGDMLTYDLHDRLIEVAGKASFTYGEGYNRLTKTNLATGGVTYYPDKLFERHPEKEVKYVYAGDLRIAKIEKELFVAPPPADPPADPPAADPLPASDPAPAPQPAPAMPEPVISAQGTGGGGGGGYASVDQLRLARLIAEGKQKEAQKLANRIRFYNLNSIQKEKNQALTAGELPESAFGNLRVTYGNHSTLIVWDSMPANIASFRVFRSKGKNAGALDDTKVFLEEIPASRFTNRYTDKHNEAGARYAYQIQAFDKNGKVLLKSQKLHVNQVFINDGRQKIVDFRNFSDSAFTHVRIKRNGFVEARETKIPQRLIFKPTSALTHGARLAVNFLTCKPKKDGSLSCDVVDEQFIEVYRLTRAKPLQKTTAHLSAGLTRLAAAFIPAAHAEGPEADTPEKVYYLLIDHLGSVDVVLDEAGNVVERRDYLPYGSERLSDSAPDSTQTAHKFTGKELDDETDLYYYGARYYDPLIGRFVSVDPWAGDLNNPQTLNKYAYVLNNPLRYVDPTGEYMKDVHYDLTYFLATAAGLDSGQAKTIATFNQYLDDNPATGPGNYESIQGIKTLKDNYFDGTTSEYHFATRADAIQGVADAIASGKLDKFGSALHTYQDTYSHAGLTPESHAVRLKMPDITKLAQKKAMEMAKGSFMLLRGANFSQNGADGLNADEYNAATEVIWGVASPLVSAFLGASGGAKADTIIGRAASLSEQDAQISSNRSRIKPVTSISAP